MSKTILLQKVMLTNFGKHSHLEVDFSAGVTVIRGANYKGKSTVLNAVRFAFFGVSGVPNSRASLVRRGAKACSVALHLMCGGEQTVLNRTLTAAGVYVNGNLVASSQTAVTAWVEDALGMDQKNILRLMASPQGETAALLTLGATALNRLIEEVADTRTVDQLMERAGEVSRLAQASLDSLPAAIDIEALETESRKLEIDIGASKFELSEVATEVTALTGTLKLISTQIQEGLQQNRRAQEAKERKAYLEGAAALSQTQVDAVEAELATTEEVDVATVEARVKKERGDLTDLKDSYSARESAAEIKAKNEEWLKAVGYPAKEKKVQLEKQSEQLRLTLVELDKQYALELRDIRDANTKVSETEEEIANSICSKCKRPMEGADVAIAKLKLEGLKAGQKMLRDKSDITYKEAIEITRQLADMDRSMPGDVLRAVAVRESLLATAVKDLAEIMEVTEGQIEVAQKSFWEVSRLLEEVLAKDNRRKTLLSTLSKQKPFLQKALDELSALVVGETVDLAELNRQRGLVENEYQKQLTVKTELTSLIAAAEVKQKRIISELWTAELNEKKRSELSARAFRFKKFQAWLRENKATFMQRTWEGLLGLASETVAIATEGAVTRIGRSDDGDFWFEEGGDILSVADCASGGQKSIMGVAMRAALPSLLSPSLPLLLDEPSSELDDAHAAALSGALRASGRQIVMVTHREGDEVSADSVVVL